MKRIAVVLSGNGHKDGSEITETVSALIVLGKKGADYKIFAPNIDVESLDHLSGTSIGIRNVLSESARIARGHISDLLNSTLMISMESYFPADMVPQKI